MGRRRLSLEERLSKSFVLEPLPPAPEIAGRTALKCVSRLWSQLPVDPTRLIQQFCGTPVVEPEELRARRAAWRELMRKVVAGEAWEPLQRPWWRVQHKTPLERIVAFKDKRAVERGAARKRRRLQ
jgi:hypothetical protein